MKWKGIWQGSPVKLDGLFERQVCDDTHADAVVKFLIFGMFGALFITGSSYA